MQIQSSQYMAAYTQQTSSSSAATPPPPPPPPQGGAQGAQGVGQEESTSFQGYSQGTTFSSDVTSALLDLQENGSVSASDENRPPPPPPPSGGTEASESSSEDSFDWLSSLIQEASESGSSELEELFG